MKTTINITISFTIVILMKSTLYNPYLIVQPWYDNFAGFLTLLYFLSWALLTKKVSKNRDYISASLFGLFWLLILISEYLICEFQNYAFEIIPEFIYPIYRYLISLMIGAYVFSGNFVHGGTFRFREAVNLPISLAFFIYYFRIIYKKRRH